MRELWEGSGTRRAKRETETNNRPSKEQKKSWDAMCFVFPLLVGTIDYRFRWKHHCSVLYRACDDASDDMDKEWDRSVE